MVYVEDKLNLISSSHFYSLEKVLTKRQVTQIASDMTPTKKGKFRQKKLKLQKVIDDFSLEYSFFVFQTENQPSFLNDTTLKENKYGYLLIIEYAGYLVISSKYATGIQKALEGIAEPVEYRKLSRFLLSEQTVFKRFSTKNTSISSYNSSIRKRTVEANNLENSFSPITASKQLVSSFGFEDNEKFFSVTMNTSRVSEKQKKTTFTEYCTWVITIINKLRNYNEDTHYLENFALPVDKVALKNLTPSSILVDFTLLRELIIDVNTAIYHPEHGNTLNIPLEKIMSILLDDTNCSFNIISNPLNPNLFYIENPWVNDVYIKRNKKSLKFSSKKLQNVVLYFDDQSINACELLNQNGISLINFESTEYAYSDNELFFDHQMEHATKSFLSVFHPYDALNHTISEKGKFYDHSDNFPDNTLFSFIEKEFSHQVDYLICDDLGNEIADYIGITDNHDINLYHAKSDTTKTLSASAFHVVVSQALKNLGSIINVNNMDLENKQRAWSKLYGSTQIKKVHSNNAQGSVDEAIEILKRNNTNPAIIKRVWLVVDFISKKDLELQLNTTPKKQTIQIIWLLSSFISECSESGIQPYIACKP